MSDDLYTIHYVNDRYLADRQLHVGTHRINQDILIKELTTTERIRPILFGIKQICFLYRFQDGIHRCTEIWYDSKRIWCGCPEQCLIEEPCEWCPGFGDQTWRDRKEIIDELRRLFPEFNATAHTNYPESKGDPQP